MGVGVGGVGEGCFETTVIIYRSLKTEHYSHVLGVC